MSLTDTAAAPRQFIRSRALRRFLSHKLALLGVFMVAMLTVVCFAGPWFLPYDELYIDLRARFAPPMTGGHIFGTDPLGRDLAARLFHAGQVSMSIGFAVMVIATTIGSVVGVVAGYYGGRVAAVLMRIVDAFLAFPSVFLLLVLAAFIKPGPAMIALIIAATSWMEVARIVEAEVKSLRDRDFVQAARMLGLSGRWIMFRELLPNAIGPIIVAATLTVARAILLEAYISFLGYGIQPPLPSWGNMLNGAQQYLQSAPWLAIVPGVAITMAVTGFNFIGDGLRDAFDSRTDLK
ncbi:ABC transporter permease [Paenirhodobacter populi]|uniref:ABC transporter permease n=1 Tax=Paenirhodobacter populi TaxID=2306993 RepID=A0A443JSM5_9RHOB|nr:ABC transporter permease [Sinirhodobacter populi]RWR09052.1 ABC transporter permease [Sinirhodobacter populi]RWR23514.1 ABC transporter permease [Sinirhodobacter populi]RWR30836.1 ABC transporter permease [Sinirhodobacter populi]